MIGAGYEKLNPIRQKVFRNLKSHGLERAELTMEKSLY